MLKKIALGVFFICFLGINHATFAPFNPFKQVTGIEEKYFCSWPQSKQKSFLQKILQGSQGTFFTQKVTPFTFSEQNNQKTYIFSFNVLQGNGTPNRAVDVAALQADPQNKGALFQVASNLDCLEANGGKNILLTDYIYYTTQGEVAVLSATPGIIDRMYLQPDIRLLKDFYWNGTLPQSAGYLPNYKLLDTQFLGMSLNNIVTAASTVHVGVQHNVTVKSGFRKNVSSQDYKAELITDNNQKITHVLTAALDPYNGKNTTTESYKNLARILLHAAYKGTFDVACTLGIKKVYLTLIGGGVFKNDYRWISEAITHACSDLSLRPEAEGMEIILIIYSQPYRDTHEWNTFASEINTLCKKHNGSWKNV